MRVAAKHKIDVARDQLAGKEMMIGRYYLNKKDFTGAINRFKIVVTQYQTTRHVEEALMRLTEAYMALGIVSEAQTAAAVLGHNFPDSRWYEDAYRLVKSGGARAGGEPGLLDQPAFKKIGRRLTGRQSRRLIHTSARHRAVAAGLVPSIRVFDDSRHLRDVMRRAAVCGRVTACEAQASMLARLSIRDIVLIDRLDIDFAGGPVGADRRDRRRQVDPARCLRAGARRARRRRRWCARAPSRAR